MANEVDVMTARGEVRLFNPEPRAGDPTRYAKAKRQVHLRHMSHDVEMHFFNLLMSVECFEDIWYHVYKDEGWRAKYTDWSTYNEKTKKWEND